MIYSKLKDELRKKKLSTEGKNMGNSSSKKNQPVQKCLRANFLLVQKRQFVQFSFFVQILHLPVTNI